MAEYLSPGVYVEELDSGLKPMEGVSTSTVGFVGMTQRGPVEGVPEFVGSFGEFQRKFGGYLPKDPYGDRRFLPMAVEQFFANGGSRCFVVRLMESQDSAAATAASEDASITFTASSAGVWGNVMTVACKPDAMDKALCTLTVVSGPNAGDYAETYNGVSIDPASEDYVCRLLEKSLLIRAAYTAPAAPPAGGLYDLFPKATDEKEGDARAITFSGGADGYADSANKLYVNAATLKGLDGGPGKRTGLCALLDTDEVSIVVCPGVTDAAEIQEIVTHCENTKNRVCILDMKQGENNVKELQAIRSGIMSSYAALYHPWIQVFDPLEKRAGYIPPSGSIAGIYARSDNTRGVHKAPANEVVRNCTGLETLFGKAEQDMLNPVGVNLIRNIQGLGIRVWGARTCSSDSSWKYINVRRLFIYIEETIRNSTGWAVFEPNDQVLWTKVRASVSSFLSTLWRNGALAGASEAEAYFVNVGKGSTMTQDDILNGRLICDIGVAPVRPAEFVIFRLTQIMEQNA